MAGPHGRTSSINTDLMPSTAVEFWEGNGGYYYNPANGRSVASNPQAAIAHGLTAVMTGQGWYLPMGPFTPANWSSYLAKVYLNLRANTGNSEGATCRY